MHHHPPPPPPPHQPPLSKPTNNLPDFLLTALSLFLFTTKHHPHPPRPLSLTLTPTSTRRLIRLSSTTTTMSQNPNLSSFPNPQSLSDWLKPRLPSDSLSAWGTKPGTKNLHNLWLELAHGETHLLDNPNSPPIRNLEVLCVRIITKDRNFILLESHQELSDGSVRTRDRPLSEKLKSGEDIQAGVKRAIREELGSVLKDDANLDEVVRVLPDSYERKVEERVSLSYPGLPACYVLHTMDAFVEGLPEGEFVTTEEGNEYGECDQEVMSEAVSVKKHFWRWVPAGSVSV